MIKTVTFKRAFQKLATVLVLLMWLGAPESNAAESRSAGRRIFLRQCAHCHGRSGEGVKGKYDEALQGERPLDKLTRYIERTMPEDDPGKCVGEDAAAVARYIYDSFYSQEARARKNPARVELVRLTKRQYVNSVADLIEQFTGPEDVLGAERGLRATYYNSRIFNAEKKAYDRLDRQVDFDFGDWLPDTEPGTNGFSIQWRGSVMAEESGDYEFILRTPNGARLWLNDEGDEPLIDAWVASGERAEHAATVRLIGGRVYPLRLNYFKFKEKTASISLRWKPPHGAAQPIPARNLIPTASDPTFVVTTPFPPDDSSVGYERGVAVSKAWDEATTQAAIETANHVVRRLDELSGTKPGQTNRAAKVQSFCREFVAAAIRRPLSQEQRQFFVENQFKRTAKVEDAVKQVVLLTLKSPRFLYLGLQRAQPDDFEIAARLSFGLWDSLPDRELSKAASQGKLKTRQEVGKQTERMLRDPRARTKMQLFLQHWLQMDEREVVSKDDQVYPGFTPEIIGDLRTSLNLFVEEVVWSPTSDYRQLLLADYVFLNDRLAAFYGIKTNLTDEFVKVSFEAGQRSGVLTHPYLLSALSYPKFTSPIHRGVFLTRNIVGRALRPPPVAVVFNDAEFAPNLTMREKVAQLTGSQACQGCHSVINPLGFSLEAYDAVGRFRTRDNDQPIDVTSEYVTDEGQTVRLGGARDVAQFALNSEQAQNAFVEQLFHHVVKQPVRAYGADVMESLRRSFVSSEFHLQGLLADIVLVSALHGLDKPPNKQLTRTKEHRPLN